LRVEQNLGSQEKNKKPKNYAKVIFPICHDAPSAATTLIFHVWDDIADAITHIKMADSHHLGFLKFCFNG